MSSTKFNKDRGSSSLVAVSEHFTYLFTRAHCQSHGAEQIPLQTTRQEMLWRRFSYNATMKPSRRFSRVNAVANN